jgi:hypothetical protein
MRIAQIDLTAPTLRVLERPKAVTVQRDATFAVNASEPYVASVRHPTSSQDTPLTGLLHLSHVPGYSRALPGPTQRAHAMGLQAATLMQYSAKDPL